MRLFVAIELSDGVRAALAREQGRLRALCSRNRDVRWTAPESLHLTLKFLGETPVERVPAVIAALEALRGFEAFELAPNGFGFFPEARHPHVFWAGFDAPPALGELARRVDAALARLGFAPENRAFTPHLTLARFRAPRADPALLKAVETPTSTSLGRFKVDEYFLFESQLLPGGAEHKKLARFPSLVIDD
jgi:RNA 2',3'-cyclic 3'-phosphodiesterase